MKDTLWIIDIDKTLVNVHRHQISAWNKALFESFKFTPDEITLTANFGKPFKSVLWDIAKCYNIPEKMIARNYSKTLSVYVDEVNKTLDKIGGELLPGAEEFLQYLGKAGAKRAIATGNPRGEAEYKLKYFNLLKYIDIAVYSDNRTERIEILKEAIQLVKDKYKLAIKNDNVFVLGDSIHDVESAKLLKVKSIAVSTGYSSKEMLIFAGADLIFPDLHNTNNLIQKLNTFILH